MALAADVAALVTAYGTLKTEVTALKALIAAADPTALAAALEALGTADTAETNKGLDVAATFVTARGASTKQRDDAIAAGLAARTAETTAFATVGTDAAALFTAIEAIDTDDLDTSVTACDTLITTISGELPV